jgi:hypothetical protein
MIFCPRCAKDVYPTQELQTNMQMLDVCPKCTAPLVPIQVVAGATAPPAALLSSKPPPPTIQITSPDLLGAVRGRVQALYAELANYEAKRAELAMLERMLLAADQPDPDVTTSASWTPIRHTNGHH